MYQQHYETPTLVAAIPIIVLLYFIAVHPNRGRFGIAAPYAAFYGVIAAFAVACGVFRMPVATAASAFSLGVLSGFVGIIWIVLAAMFLYTITVITGTFEIVKESIVSISVDRRLQVLLIAFSFGAIIEGTSGFGTPVAIAGAVMVGLGYSPFQSAVLNLLANTAPVAWGAIGTPIVTLAAVSGLDQLSLSAMAGRQLPWVSILVPFWLVVTFVKMEKGTWAEAFEVWPGALVCGATFALMQHFASASPSFHLMTDVVAGVFSVVCTALFMKYAWHPKRLWTTGEPRAYGYTTRETIRAWTPWAILILCCAIWGMPALKKRLNEFSAPAFEMPRLHNQVQRMPPVAPPNAKPEAAKFTLNWLSAAGTGVFVAALASGVFLGLSRAQWKEAALRTASRMKTPVIVIAQVLGLGFLTRYSGMDAVLGLAFTSAGGAYPFFAAYLGWLGVFLTGSDTASNALFGSLQRITAQQLHLNEVLIVATNSTGGVMGKMIDAQSIMVACAACYDDPIERAHALGPIFRKVWWHSVAGAAVIGVIALIQSYI
jgi:lactate permease